MYNLNDHDKESLVERINNANVKTNVDIDRFYKTYITV